VDVCFPRNYEVSNKGAHFLLLLRPEPLPPPQLIRGLGSLPEPGVFAVKIQWGKVISFVILAEVNGINKPAGMLWSLVAVTYSIACPNFVSETRLKSLKLIWLCFIYYHLSYTFRLVLYPTCFDIYTVIFRVKKVKLSLCSTNLSTTPWRRMEEWMYTSTFSWSRH
jgi:hypothetical protein